MVHETIKHFVLSLLFFQNLTSQCEENYVVVGEESMCIGVTNIKRESSSHGDPLPCDSDMSSIKTLASGPMCSVEPGK